MFWPQANRYEPHAPAFRASRGDPAMWFDTSEQSDGMPDRPERKQTSDPIITATGMTFAIRHATTLTEMFHGKPRHLGDCRIGGLVTTWDYWFPHLGIAVDVQRATDQQADAKLAWATERNILYFSPQVNATNGRINTELLTQAATERRAC